MEFYINNILFLDVDMVLKESVYTVCHMRLMTFIPSFFYCLAKKRVTDLNRLFSATGVAMSCI